MLKMLTDIRQTDIRRTSYHHNSSPLAFGSDELISTIHDYHGRESGDYTTKIRADVCRKSYDSCKTRFDISVNTG